MALVSQYQMSGEAVTVSKGMIPASFCLLALLTPPCLMGEIQHLSIKLLPRNYTHPRDRPGFTCGVQELDSSRYLAELSSTYILGQLDNTGDPDTRYRTTVQDMAFLTPKGIFHLVDSPCITNCTSLFSLVLVPPTGSCFQGMFADAKTLSKDHIVLFVGGSCRLPIRVSGLFNE